MSMEEEEEEEEEEETTFPRCLGCARRPTKTSSNFSTLPTQRCCIGRQTAMRT
jgi:hypothetical protein